MHLDPQPAPARPAPVVLKFGGVGLASGERVRRACGVIAECASERPVVVVSAIGEVTALLEEVLRAAAHGAPDTRRVRLRHKRLLSELGLEPGLCNRHLSELETLLAALAGRGEVSPAERDHVLAFGERMSARLFAAALRATGVPATPVDAWDLGLVSDSNHGRARPLASALAVVGDALARVPGVAVVTGFVAADVRGRLTTLGRSGSDLSAALIAEACGARELQLWKTVRGVMSADPRLVPEARTLPELSWSQAATLAFHGADVLHVDALAPLERARIPARVLDLDHPDEPGTHIGPRRAAHGVLGLACRRELALARLVRDARGPQIGLAALLGRALVEHGVEPLATLASPDELVLLARADTRLDNLQAALEPHARIEGDLASIALVATRGGPPAAEGLAALTQADLAPCFAWTDARRETALWVLPEAHLPAAARALHLLTFSYPHDPNPALRSAP